MRKALYLPVLATLCAIVLSFAGPANAQAVMWVSATGSGSICSTAAPCGTFQAAITAGGTEIHCINSGNYGPVTITQSITIDCGTGNVGSIAVGSGGTGVTINTNAAIVVLRHLSISGNSQSSTGIDAAMISGALIVEDSTVTGFALGSNGITFRNSGGRGLLQISNTRVTNNATGISVEPAVNQIASVNLNRVEVSGSTSVGVLLNGGIVAGIIRDSVVAGNGTEGVYSSASQVFLTIDGSAVVANLSGGIRTNSSGALVTVTNTTVSGNSIGVISNAGSLVSLGNNTVTGNATNGNFTATTPLR